MSYIIRMPQAVVFGAGAIRELATHLPEGAERVLLVCGPSAVRNGLTARIAELLAPRRVTVFAEVTPEPSIQLVDRVRNVLRENASDAVIGLGGGSAMDAAKVVAAAGMSALPTAEYFYGRSSLPARGLWCGCIPTTAGTGAEVTPNGVYVDSDTSIKQSIRGGTMLPALALVDPELTVSCPANVTAASGLDALTQGIESYLSNKANHATQAWAMAGVKLIWNALEAAWRNGDDLAARRDMSEGTLLGAAAFATSGLGAVHGLAHPVGAKYHIGHGKVCGILLPEILRWNDPVVGKRMEELSAGLGLASVSAMISQIEAWLVLFGFPLTLKSLGLQECDFDWIVEHSRSGSMRCNPRAFSDAELKSILQEML